MSEAFAICPPLPSPACPSPRSWNGSRRPCAQQREGGVPDHREADALLGLVPEPPLTVSKALEEYWTAAADRTRGKSADQIRRWENPRKKAVANFIKAVGDVALADIGAQEMRDFRAWWVRKVEDDDLTPNSANKDFTHLKDVLGSVIEAMHLTIDLPLRSLKMLKDDEARTRPPFSVAWIRDKLLAPGALDGLNLEARAILLGMVNTGCRPSELQNLTRAQIRLDDPVPHLSIEGVGRTLKSRNAKRRIPLVGVSLGRVPVVPGWVPALSGQAGPVSDGQQIPARERALRDGRPHPLLPASQLRGPDDRGECRSAHPGRPVRSRPGSGAIRRGREPGTDT